jgi:hypothetical protein
MGVRYREDCVSLFLGSLCFFVLESEWVSEGASERVSEWVRERASEWGSELRGLLGNYVAVGGAQILTSDF